MAYDPSATANTDHCVICMEKFSDDQEKELVELACNKDHIFHKKCIENNINVAGDKRCPMCRKDINLDELEDEINADFMVKEDDKDEMA